MRAGDCHVNGGAPRGAARSEGGGRAQRTKLAETSDYWSGLPVFSGGRDAVSPGRLAGGLSGPRRAGETGHADSGDQGVQMADVFRVLSQDHEEVKRMLAELEKGPTGSPGPARTS